jgi:hypothetical protein
MQIAKKSFCLSRNTKLKFEDPDLLSVYKCGNFDVPESERLSSLQIPDLTDLRFEYKSNDLRDNFGNGKKLYEKLQITPLQASDERLWVYLTHVTFKDYMLKLRPIENKGGTYIKTHYFVQTAKYLFLNDISLLWWLFHLSAQPENKNDPYRLTRELFSLADYTRTLFGGNIGRALGVRYGVLEFVASHEDLFKNYKAQKVRFLIRLLNQTAGHTLISFLSNQDIYEILDNNKTRIAEVKNAETN